jgi:uncharacterized protein
MTESIITVRNRAGHALHCILHEPAPDLPKSDLACLLLSPGVKMRVAPHRLYRKLAPEFLCRGIPVLRVDFHGLGDSEGELPETMLDQLYRQVQLGRHVDDARAAIEYCARELGSRRFIVGGLCGGALTGLLAAEHDQRIVGLYALGIPVVLDGAGRHEAANMTRGQLRSVRSKYLRKLLQPSAWLRLLSFRSDLRLLLASILPGFKRPGGRGAAPEPGQVPAPSTPPAANVNMTFVRAYFKLLASRTPMLLLFSGADRLQWEYDEKIARPWAASLHKTESCARVVVIPHANHVLGDPAWVAEGRRHTGAWLDSHFPSGAAIALD